MDMGILVILVLSVLAVSSGEVCPASTHPSCASGMTCCLLPSGQQGCCPYRNATCCQDRVHCCPTGSTCVKDAGGHCRSEQMELASIFPASVIKHDTNMKLLEPAAPVATHNQQCGDGTQCLDDATCCPMGGGQYGCCPLMQAVCCADKQHCCPHGSICNPEGFCQGLTDRKVGFKWPIKPKKLSAVVCPGGQEQCPNETTCCALSVGEWGCCPMKSAECCSDMKHCCPNGYRCSSGQCYKKKHVFLP